MSSLQGQQVVVTGGGTGIGLGIAEAFCKAGAKVCIAGRRADVLEQALATLKECGDASYGILDVADRAATERFFREREAEGPVEILAMCAGINIKKRSMTEMDPAEWDRVMAINATGPYNCLHAVLPPMLERKRGLIVNVSSIAGKRALELGGIAYCASKFAATALGTSVGNELAPRGIRITNVYPGEVDTPLLEHRPTPVSEERRAAMLLPSDVAELVVAIASLPPRAHVPEIVVKPLVQHYV